MNNDLLTNIPASNDSDGLRTSETAYATWATRKLPVNARRLTQLIDRRGLAHTVAYGPTAGHPSARLCVDFSRHPNFFYRKREKRLTRAARRERAIRVHAAPARVRKARRWEPIIRESPIPGGPLGLGRRRAVTRERLLRKPRPAWRPPGYLEVG
jgi:hypothetical protein